MTFVIKKESTDFNRSFIEQHPITTQKILQEGITIPAPFVHRDGPPRQIFASAKLKESITRLSNP
jgi:hypothetical protein